MNEKTKITLHTGDPEYDKTFGTLHEVQMDTKECLLCVPIEQQGVIHFLLWLRIRFSEALNKESLFRRIGTTMNALNNAYRIFAKDCEDIAMWVPEGGTIPIYEGIEDFTEHRWKAINFQHL